MAIVVVTNGQILVNSVDLSDHAKSIVVDLAQETREVTTMGASARNFRAGLQNPSITAVFRNDSAASSVEATLRALITSATSGAVPVFVKKINTASTTVNPAYQFTLAIIDGDLNLLDAEVGEVPDISVKFVPYSGTLTVTTSAT